MQLASHSHAHVSSHHLITNLCILYIANTVMSGAHVCIYYISGLKFQMVTRRKAIYGTNHPQLKQSMIVSRLG